MTVRALLGLVFGALGLGVTIWGAAAFTIEAQGDTGLILLGLYFAICGWAIDEPALAL